MNNYADYTNNSFSPFPKDFRKYDTLELADKCFRGKYCSKIIYNLESMEKNLIKPFKSSRFASNGFEIHYIDISVLLQYKLNNKLLSNPEIHQYTLHSLGLYNV